MSKRNQPTKGQRFEAMEQTISNLETSVRIMQMMQQQMGNSLMPMQQDMSGLSAQMQTISYTNLAMQELLGVDAAKLDGIYQRLRLADYTEASDKEDQEKGYMVANEVESDQDIVILSSTTPDENKDAGIFRSKMIVGELGPDLAPVLMGKKVGDTFEHKLQDVNHLFVVKAVRKVPVVEEAPVEAPVEKCGGCDDKGCECDEK